MDYPFDDSDDELDIEENNDDNLANYSTDSLNIIELSNKESSWIYKHVIINNDTIQCRYCSKFYFSNKFYTSTMGRHLKIHNISNKNQSTNIDSMEQLIYSFVDGNIPFRFVENEYFKKFISSISNTFSLPSRKSISKLIKEKADICKEIVKDELKKAEYVTLVIDCWTSSRMDHYLGVNAHWISDDGKSLKLKVRFLGAFLLRNEIDSKEKSTNLIVKNLKEIIFTFGLTKKLTCIVSDKGTDVKKAIENLGYLDIWEPCFIHSVNRCFNDCFENNPVSTWSKFQSLSKFCKHSIAFENESSNRNIPKLPTFSFTRWGGIVNVLDIYLKNLDKFDSALIHLDKENLVLDLNLKYALIKIHEAFYPIIEIFNFHEAEKYPTSDFVMHHFNEIHKNIVHTSKKLKSSDIEVKNCLQLFISGLKKRCKDKAGRFSEIKKICHFLNPFLKNNKDSIANIDHNTPENLFKYHDYIEEVKKLLLNEMEKIKSSSISVSQDRFHDEYIPDSYKRALKKIKLSEVTSQEEELEKYFKQSLPSNYCTTLDYWNSCRTTFPTLFKLAKKYLGIPSSAASIERCWSIASMIDSSKRNRLSKETLNALIFLKCFINKDQ